MNTAFITDLRGTINEPKKMIELEHYEFNDLVNKVFPFLDYEIVATGELKNYSKFTSDGYGDIDIWGYNKLFEGDPNTHVLVQLMINMGILPDGYEFIISVNY